MPQITKQVIALPLYVVQHSRLWVNYAVDAADATALLVGGFDEFAWCGPPEIAGGYSSVCIGC